MIERKTTEIKRNSKMNVSTTYLIIIEIHHNRQTNILVHQTCPMLHILAVLFTICLQNRNSINVGIFIVLLQMNYWSTTHAISEYKIIF